jgi:malate dehydrogenase (oxaloacetate-decarboxylating)(NADP+)
MLMLNGISAVGFAVMQATLVYRGAPVEMRARAMGVLSVCIGTSPLGFLYLGLLADTFTPRVAMLGYSNFGSAEGPTQKKVAEATAMLSARRPDLQVEGDIQANVALDYALQKSAYPFTRLDGPANVLIFPTLEAGNVAYKLIRELGDVPAVGPVLLGMNRPVTVLERDCTVDNVVHMAALTVVAAQQADGVTAAAGATRV